MREQFGQKIGAFQSIKHLCAEMLETAEAVTAAAWDVRRIAFAYDDGGDDQWAFAADVALVTCFDGAVDNAKACIQVLGGIGFTHEHDAHLYLRRAMSLRSLVEASDAAAERLTDRAVAGVRRQVHVDLEGRDEAIRADVRAEAAAARGAAGRGAAPGPGRQRLPDAALAGAVRPGRRRRDPDRHRRRARPRRREAPRHRDRRAGRSRRSSSTGPTSSGRRFVRPSLLGELVWCQLFSEPGAGSDLASLRTRAEKVDGGWKLSGQKVWNSVAERADWGICLARTDPDAPKHKGICYFLVDMRSPGIDVRPLREITGEALFNEVFLDDVFVPDDLLVGDVDDGWKLARTTLANERVAMANSRLSKSTERAVTLAADGAHGAWRTCAWAAPSRCRRSARCSPSGRRCARWPVRVPAPSRASPSCWASGTARTAPSSSSSSRATSSSTFDDEFKADVWEMLNTRCLSIAGGTTQILRNVAGERILGLPRG